MIAWGAFYLMDRWWYHPLLLGSVQHAEGLEAQLEAQTPGIGLTGAIRDASHTRLLGRERRSTWKMNAFYLLVAVVLVVLLVVILFTPVGDSGDERRVPPTPRPEATGA
jgi:hypothetical protein